MVYLILGGIFDEGDDALQQAFQFAVNGVKEDRSLLVRTQLIPQADRIPKGDSFKASKRGKVFNFQKSLDR